MTTYNYDPILIDGFTACWTCALYAGGGNCKSSAILHLMQFSIRWVPFACIIKMQFENLRDGDRFFFSHGVEDATCLRGPILLLDQMQEPEGDILRQPRANCSPLCSLLPLEEKSSEHWTGGQIHRWIA